MNLRTTLVLVVLAAAGGVVWWVGPKLPPKLAPAPAPEVHADEGTLTVFEKEITPESTKSIKIVRGKDTLLSLDRGDKGGWVMPGGWPTRAHEVNELVSRLASLRSRFAPFPLKEDGANLKEYGLDTPAFVVTVKAGRTEHTLTFSEGQARDNDFYRPTYVRLDDRSEAIRLGPGLLSLLGRPREFYQKRSLFPHERVARNTTSSEKVERLDGRRVEVEDRAKGGASYVLERKEQGWQLSQPTLDRLDPDKRNTVLEAIADLWAERFVQAAPDDAAAAVAAPAPGEAGLAAGIVSLIRAAQTDARDWLLFRTGLDKPERSVRVRHADGEATLLIGKVAGTTAPPPPANPLAPPPMNLTGQEFRYARLQGNEQIFVIKAHKLKDIFVAPASLRDTHLAHFDNKDVRRVEVSQGGSKLVLFRDDKDRWKMHLPSGDALAEEGKVTELLNQLAGLTAQEKETDGPAGAAGVVGLFSPPLPPGAAAALVGVPRLPQPWQPETALASVRLTIKGEDKKERSIVLSVGQHDELLGQLLMKVGDWPRTHRVEDSVLARLRRPALAYRGKLFDFTPTDVTKLVIEQKGKKLALEQADGKWRLTLPAPAEADATKAGQLAETLAKLEPTEYVAEGPPATDLETTYGLSKPALSVTVQAKGQLKTLKIGKKHKDKAEYFAALDGSPSVFVVGADIHDALGRDALSYLPRKLWQTDPGDVKSVRVEKAGDEPYVLERQPKDTWKLGKPFDAAAGDRMVKPLVDVLSSPQADHYEALSATDLKAYGLDKPHLKLTVTGKGGTHELLIGNKVKDGTARYAKRSDSPAVAVLRGEVVRDLDHPAVDLLDTLLLNVSLDDVQRVESKHKDGRLVLEKKGDAWTVVEAPSAPFAADTNAVNALRALLFNLRAERIAAYGPKVDLKKYALATPATTVILTLQEAGKKPVERTLELGGAVEGKPGQRYARLDKGPGVAVLAAEDANLLARTYLDYVDHKLLSFPEGKVTSLQRQKRDETLELVKKGSEWQFVKPEPHRADDATLGMLVRQLSGLRAAAIAEYPLKDEKKYGLDYPFAVLTIHFTGADGKPVKYTLKLGKEVADKGWERYARVEGSKAVAVLPGALARVLTAKSLAFRNRDLVQFNDADRILLERGRRKATFARVGDRWTMTAPVEAQADHDQMKEFLGKVTQLKADELVGDRPDDLRKCGLETPIVRWRFQADGKDQLDLLIGKADPASRRRYARLGKGKLVFLLDADLSKLALAEFRDRTVWSTPLDAAQVETHKLTHGDKTLLLRRDGSAWKVEGKPEVKLSAETVNDTLAALTGLKVDHYAVDKEADFKLFGLEPPQRVVEAELAGRKMMLYLGHPEGDSKRLYARALEKGRSDVMVLSEEDSARLTRDLAALQKPLSKKPKPPGLLPPDFPGKSPKD
jgi:hypothetical protein